MHPEPDVAIRLRILSIQNRGKPMNRSHQPDQALLRAFPKTDLHVHLDGSLRPATVRELAARYSLPFAFATDQDVLDVCQVDERCESLEDYLKVFDITLQLMQSADDLERISFELAEDAHRETCVTWKCGIRPCCTRSRA